MFSTDFCLISLKHSELILSHFGLHFIFALYFPKARKKTVNGSNNIIVTNIFKFCAMQLSITILLLHGSFFSYWQVLVLKLIFMFKYIKLYRGTIVGIPK